MVIFDEGKHTYFNPDTKRFYISVSKLLSLYKEPFDKDYHANRVALREGVKKEDVINRWAKTTELACEKGINVHSIVEKYIKTGIVDDNALIDALSLVFNKKDYKRILSEEIVYNDTYEIAGTSDIICDVNNNLFDVYDFKTNKSFTFENKYNKCLKSPLQNLQQCHYNDYSLQLSLYAFLYGDLTNKKVRKISILYHDGNKFHRYPVPYMFWEVSALLKHYTINHNTATPIEDKLMDDYKVVD